MSFSMSGGRRAALQGASSDNEKQRALNEQYMRGWLEQPPTDEEFGWTTSPTSPTAPCPESLRMHCYLFDNQISTK